MDSFEFNKIAMSVLGVVFLVMSLNFLSEGLFHSEAPETKGYKIEVADSGDSDSGDAAPAGPDFEPISALLANADVAAGEALAGKRCTSCHVFEEGGKNKAGPALYDVVNRDIASGAGFSYSAAMKTYGAAKQWSFEELNGFLWKPKKFVKGTAMAFPGLKKPEERAAIVAYLRTLSGSPAPLPSEAAPATEEQAPATEETQPAVTEQAPASEETQPAASE